MQALIAKRRNNDLLKKAESGKKSIYLKSRWPVLAWRSSDSSSCWDYDKLSHTPIPIQGGHRTTLSNLPTKFRNSIVTADIVPLVIQKILYHHLSTMIILDIASIISKNDMCGFTNIALISIVVIVMTYHSNPRP